MYMSNRDNQKNVCTPWMNREWLWRNGKCFAPKAIFSLQTLMFENKPSCLFSSFSCFSGCFCAYVGQPHDHIGWAISMPFASINLTIQRINLWNFREKISRIGDFEKWPFWKIGHFEFFLKKKNNFFFASFSWKSVQICMVEWMGRNFDIFPGFQQISSYA